MNHLARICLVAIAAASAAIATTGRSHAQEPMLQINVDPDDPCQAVANAIAARPRSAGATRVLNVGPVRLSVKTFAYAVCEKARSEITDAVKKRVKALQKEIEQEVLSKAGSLYDEVIASMRALSKHAYDALPAAERAQISEESYFDRWLLEQADSLARFVNDYVLTHAERVAELLESLTNDGSKEIVDGLQKLWERTEDRRKKLQQVEEELKKAPKATRTEEYLVKYGLKGEWIERLRGYETQFNRIDRDYDLLATAAMVRDAFTAETYEDRLEGMFGLLGKFGGSLSSSRAPGVQLIGDLIQTLADLAKDALVHAKEVGLLIRQREDLCIGLGTHTLTDEVSRALQQVAGDVQACPLDLKDEFLQNVYNQTEPPNARQFYFWTGKRMIKGHEDGGGIAGLEAARRFIEEVVEIGYRAYAGKEDNIRAVAGVYNTTYTKTDALSGVPGLVFTAGLAGLQAEGEAVIDAIVKRVRELRDFGGLDRACDERGFTQMIEIETGLRLAAFPLDNEDELRKLKLSYVLGYILLKKGDLPEGGGRTAAYTTYGEIWRKLAPLSMVRLEGTLVRSDGASCPQCADVPIQIVVSAGAEMAGCRVGRTARDGSFIARLVTRSPDVAATFRARVGNTDSETIGVDKKQLQPSGAPFSVRFAFKMRIDLKGEADWATSLDRLRALHGQAVAQDALAREGCAAARAAIAEMATIPRDLAALMEAATRQIAAGKVALGGDAVAGTTRQQGALTAARAAAESAATAKKQAEASALRACEETAKLRSTDAPGSFADRQSLLRAVSADAAAARNFAAEAGKDRQLATAAGREATEVARAGEDRRDTLVELAASRQRISALAEQLKGVDQRAAAARGRALAAAGKLAEIAANARPIHDDVLARASRVGGPQAAQAIATANDLVGAIQSFLAAATACMSEVDKQRSDQAGGAGVSDTIAAIDAVLGGKNPLQRISELKSGADAVKAYVDVAEVMEGAARSAAENAETCRKLAEAALTAGRSDDLSAAAEAAIGICEFERAKTAIETMPAGAARDRVADRYRAAVSRERAVRALYEEARALFGAGDKAASLAKLAVARAQTACDRYAALIDQTTTQVRSGLADEEVGAAEAAIADCRFSDALAQIQALGAHPRLAELNAAYASAWQREQQTLALWNEARALAQGGRRAEALARYNQALSNTQCSASREQIRAAIAQLHVPVTPPGPPPGGITEQQCARLYEQATNVSVMAGLGAAAGSAAATLGSDVSDPENRVAYSRALALYQQGANLCRQGRFPALFAKGIQETMARLGRR